MPLQCTCPTHNAKTVRSSGVHTNPNKSDPTRTTMLRRKFERKINSNFAKLRKALHQLLVVEDAFGIKQTRNKETENGYKPSLRDLDDVGSSIVRLSPVENVNEEYTYHYEYSVRNGQPIRIPHMDTFRLVSNQRFAFKSTPEQLVLFEAWLQQQLGAAFTSERDKYWEQFVREGYNKGAGRAFSDVNKAKRALRPISKTEAETEALFEGSREQFLQEAFGQTESIEKVKLLASRSLTDLKGVSGSVATRMNRLLVEGLSQGDGPRSIAKRMSEQLNIDQRRAQTIARTEIIRAHAEGQLDAMARMGVEKVGVMVEWSTAGDDRVCPLCAPLGGVTLKLKEARGMLPRHANCRCSWIPAQVGEKDPSTKKSKTAIQKSIDKSISRERKKGSLAQKKARSTWTGADKSISKARPKSILDRKGVPTTKLQTKKVTPKPGRKATIPTRLIPRPITPKPSRVATVDETIPKSRVKLEQLLLKKTKQAGLEHGVILDEHGNAISKIIKGRKKGGELSGGQGVQLLTTADMPNGLTKIHTHPPVTFSNGRTQLFSRPSGSDVVDFYYDSKERKSIVLLPDGRKWVMTKKKGFKSNLSGFDVKQLRLTLEEDLIIDAGLDPLTDAFDIRLMKEWGNHIGLDIRLKTITP